jgi:hypothetical protein
LTSIEIVYSAPTSIIDFIQVLTRAPNLNKVKVHYATAEAERPISRNFPCLIMSPSQL